MTVCVSLSGLHSAELKKGWELTETVWGLGMVSTCKIAPDDPLSFQANYWNALPSYDESALEGLESGDTVWVKARFLPHFSKEVIQKIKVPFVLVITEGDETFPTDFVKSMDIENFIADKKIIHIFAQNCDNRGLSQKVSQLPIGVDFHSISTIAGGYWGETGSPLAQEALLKSVLKELKPTDQRISKAFVDFHHYDSIRYGGGNRYIEFGEDRTMIFNKLKANGIVDYGSRMKRSDLWKKKGEYAFSVSPHGNGLDCHRTWEDLVLGCIVIVKTSPLDPLYDGLPVVIVKDWSEVTQENMNGWLKQYGDAFNRKDYREKLTNDYWLSKVKSVAKSYKEQKIQ